MHLLLSMNDEQLDELAKRIAEVRKMTPEERAKALEALPKPKMPRMAPGKRPFSGAKAPHRACGKPAAPYCADGNRGKALPPPPPPAENK